MRSLVPLLVLFMVGCQAAVPPAAHPVTHVVIMWLKSPNDADAQRQLIETSKSFHTIPGVRSVAVGRMIPSERPVVDSTYDVALVISFQDLASLRAYETSARHKAALANVLQPLVKKIVVYDFAE